MGSGEEHGTFELLFPCAHIDLLTAEHFPLCDPWNLGARQDFGNVGLTIIHSPPSLLILMMSSHYKGAADKSAQPLAFVGKGITFDSGGISLKPGAVSLVHDLRVSEAHFLLGHEIDAGRYGYVSISFTFYILTRTQVVLLPLSLLLWRSRSCRFRASGSHLHIDRC